MPSYRKREYRLGPYYLAKRPESPSWQRCWVEGGKLKRVSLKTEDWDEAKRRLDRFWAEHYKLELYDQPPSKVKLDAVLHDYETQYAPRLRSYKTVLILFRHWRDFWGDVFIADLRPLEKQEAFRNWLAAKGHSPMTVSRTLEMGKAAIRRAWKRGMLSSVPHIEIPPYVETEPKGRPLSIEEIGKLLGGTEERHMQLFVLLALGTASRPEALCQLTWGQIDFDAGLIRLNPEGRKQTSKRRPTVKLPPTLGSVLKPLSGHAQERVLQFHGKPLGKVTNGFKRMVGRSKLEGKVRPYSLRHSAARYMRQQGVPLEEVANQLGHVMPSFEMSMRYAPDAPDYLREAVKALDKLVALVLPAASQLHATPEKEQAATGT